MFVAIFFYTLMVYKSNNYNKLWYTPSSGGEIVGKTGIFNLGMATGLERKRLKPVKLHLRIDLLVWRSW